MSRLFGNAFGYSIANIANAAVPFLLLPILTRVLSPESYGVIAMFAAVVTVFGSLASLNVHGSVTVRYFKSSRDELLSHVGSCMLVVSVGAVGVTLMVAVFGNTLVGFTSVPIHWLYIAVAVAAFNALMQIRLALWIAEGRVAPFGAFQFGRTLLDFLLSLLLVLVFLMDFDGRLLGRTASTLLFGLLAVAVFLRYGLQALRPSREGVRRAVAFGAPLIPHTLGLMALQIADRFVINASLGTDATGVYMVAVQLGLGIGLLTDAFNKAYAPWLYRRLRVGNASDLVRIVRGTWAYFALIALAAGLLAMMANWLVSVLAGAGFAGAAKAFAWIAFGQAFNGMYLMVTNYIFYQQKTVGLGVSTLLSGVLGIALLVQLVPSYGIEGAGMAFTAAMAFRFVSAWFLAQRAYPMPWIRAMLSPAGGA